MKRMVIVVTCLAALMTVAAWALLPKSAPEIQHANDQPKNLESQESRRSVEPVRSGETQTNRDLLHQNDGDDGVLVKLIVEGAETRAPLDSIPVAVEAYPRTQGVYPIVGRTDQAGTFEFRAPAKKITIYVNTTDRGDSRFERGKQILLPSQLPSNTLRIRLRMRDAILQVQVTDERGLPLEGVTVVGRGTNIARSVTRKNGSVTFKNLAPGTLHLSLEPGSWQKGTFLVPDEEQQVELLPHATRHLRISVERNGEIHTRLLYGNSQDSPTEELRVTLTCIGGRYRSRTYAAMSVHPGQLLEIPDVAPGSYRIAYMIGPRSPYWVSHGALEPVVVRSGQVTRHTQTAMHAKGGLSGRVIGPDGQAVAGIPVGVVRRKPPTGKAEQFPGKQVNTDKLGRFQIQGLPQGQYILIVRPEALPATSEPGHPGLLPFGTTQNPFPLVQAPSSGLQVHLRRACRIQGFVRSNGKPVLRGEVKLVSTASNFQRTVDLDRSPDGRVGHFYMGGLADGRYTLTFSQYGRTFKPALSVDLSSRTKKSASADLNWAVRSK